MAKIITLRYPSECKECGTPLPAGTRARWYRHHGVYGLNCHQKQAVAPDTTAEAPEATPEGAGSALLINYGSTPIARVPGPSQEDYLCTDRGYEDWCAARTGVDRG